MYVCMYDNFSLQTSDTNCSQDTKWEGEKLNNDFVMQRGGANSLSWEAGPALQLLTQCTPLPQ